MTTTTPLATGEVQLPPGATTLHVQAYGGGVQVLHINTAVPTGGKCVRVTVELVEEEQV